MSNTSSKPCSLVVVRPDGRRLAGTAAQLAHISDAGGWDAFLQQVASQVISNFAAAYNARAQQPRLNVVGGKACMQPVWGGRNAA